MLFKSYIKTQISGKLIERKIRGEPGELYILHKGMKAFIEYESHLETDTVRTSIYKIKYYIDK